MQKLTNTPMNDMQMNEDLSREAADVGPAFSSDLHARIMARIDAEPPRAAVVPTASRSYWQLGGALAAAAAVVLAVGIFRFNGSISSPTPHPVAVPVVAVQVPAAPTIVNPIHSLQGPALRDWAGTQCADVNRDAGNVVAYVERQFDMLPPVR